MNNSTDSLLAELQTLWDEQDRRIGHILATRTGVHPRVLALRRHAPWHRRIMYANIVLIVLNVAAALFCLFSLCSDPYLLLRLTGYLLVAANACMILHCFRHLYLIRRRRPALSSHIGATRAPFSPVRQVAAASVAALVVLLAVSCSPIGDGYAMTKVGRADRAAAIVTVDNILHHIS